MSRRVGYWLLVLCACALTALLFVTVINAMVRADRAERSRDTTASSASRRIDLLNQRIVQLQDQAVANGRDLGALTTQVVALAEQIRQLGGRPIVDPPAARTTPTTARPGTSTTPPSSTTTTTPPPSTTTTTTTPREPPDDNEPSLPCRVAGFLPGVCP